MTRSTDVGLKVSFVESLADIVTPVVQYLNASDTERDLFDVDHIVVPNAGVRAWLLQQIASQVGTSAIGNDGIAANVSIKYLGELDALIGRRTMGADPWAVGPLSMTVLSVINKHSGSFTSHIERLGGGLKAARLMSDRFDKYHARRPSMIVEWEAGRANLAPVVGEGVGNGEHTIEATPLDASDVWQFDLWRLVREEVGAQPWPVMVEEMLANPSLLDDADLPPRLLVVGLQSLSVRHVRALQLLSQHMTVEVVLVHPSPALASQWAVEASRVPVSIGVAPLPIRVSSFEDNVDAMVSMWLRGAHDAQMVLASQGVSPAVHSLADIAAPVDLLHSLQNAVHQGVATNSTFTPGDRSFQVHRAHNLSRQVEITRDAILHAFHDIDGLEPHEVVIICADVEAAAPLLEAAFSREVGGRPLPFIVADRGLRQVDDGASLLNNLLTVVTGRFSIADIMTVATSPVVMQKFGASADDVASWYRLIDRTRIRWGASAEHRNRLGVDSDVAAHTWVAGLQRALVGALLPDAEPDIDFGGAVPLPDLDAADLESVGRLSAIVSAMSSLEVLANTTAELPVIDWADAVQDTLMALALSNKGELDDALEAINTLRGYVTDACGADIDSLTVTFEHFVEQLAEQISSAPGRQPLRTGAITATSSVPLRGVPFKVVCLLGFDEGTMRAGEVEGDDLVSRQVFMGDIDPRIDQRRSILDAICAASHRVVITCNGRSIKNNAEVPLITPLAELLDLCGRCGVPEFENNKGFLQVEYQHPRHFSSPRNFIEGEIVPGMVWSHDEIALRSIVETHVKTQAAIDAEVAAARMAESGEDESYRVITPRELDSFLKDPLSAFVRSGLGISTWNDADDDEPATIPLELTQKEIGYLRGNLASAVQSGFATQHWVTVNSAVGNIPLGAYGSNLADELVGRVDELGQVASDWGINLDVMIPYEIRVPYSCGEVVGNLMVHPASENHIALVDLGKKSKTSEAKLRDRLGLWLLLLHASGHHIEGAIAVVVGEETRDKVVYPTTIWHYVQLSPHINQDIARDKVEQLAALFEEAVRTPFPKFSGTIDQVLKGDMKKAEDAFDSYLSMANKSKDGEEYKYLETMECLVYGMMPKFDDIFFEGSPTIDFYARLAATAIAKDDELAKDLGLKNLPPTHVPAGKKKEEVCVRMSDVLNLETQALENGLFIEASAGTGKTYSVAALVVRELAMNEDLSISQILVTTFTRNAAAELRDRIRRRLVRTAESLKKNSNEDADVIVEYLLDPSVTVRDERANRLMRAVVEFDTATIATIHSVCSKIISLSAESTKMAGEEVQDRLIAEVVNDALVAQASISPILPEKKIVEVVKQLIGEPLTQTWFDTSVVSDIALMNRIDSVIKGCVVKIEEELRKAPTFDYLIRRAFQVISSDEVEGVLAEFRRRYKYLIVDEAQDTDSQQWQIFRGIFPLGEDISGSLIAVGDPKQSIYKFRGADIDAYRTERDLGTTRTLRTNFRSDTEVINGLNALFAETEFGAGIPYVAVDVPEEKKNVVLTGMSPVEILNVPDPSGTTAVASPATRRVSQYLQSPATIDGHVVRPSDIVVLVRSGWQGQLIERELRELNIPAVSTGTASVMNSETAEHWRVLLRALERFADAGRVRHVVGTPLFGVPLTSSALLDDAFIGSIQETLAEWSTILRKQGVAALTASLLSDPSTIMSLSAGLSGERRLTDFSHIADLLNAETNGIGCSATDVLDAFARLVEVDDSSELVSRRVESDSSAVQIMTIHVSKGLEFPMVVVADSWKEEISTNQKKKLPIIRLQKEDCQPIQGRVADIGFVTDEVSGISLQRLQEEASEESARLLYVAATRAKHHVCIVRPVGGKVTVIDNRMSADVLAGESGAVKVLNVDELLHTSTYVPLASDIDKKSLQVAISPSTITQTYRRTSFTGITELQKGGSVVGAARVDTRAGTEEGERLFIRSVGYASNKTLLGVDQMPLARIPGGAHIGKILHSVYEHVDPAHENLSEHVSTIVRRHVSGKLLTEHGQNIIDGIVLSLLTPLGGAVGQHSLASLGLKNRVAEMSFEMSLAHLTAGVKASDIGRLLQSSISGDDLLTPYAVTLCDPSFDISLAGLVNGSIDALLRVEMEAGVPRFFISDYKSNRLDRDGDASMIDAYSTERMLHEMEHHHYPLQAIIYGAAVYRFLRWRAPQVDADAAIAGFAYMFIRGMVGEATPIDEHGNRSGVLTWTAPAGFWRKLSDLFAGGAQ